MLGLSFRNEDLRISFSKQGFKDYRIKRIYFRNKDLRILGLRGLSPLGLRLLTKPLF
jgi:hypothetical protein